MRRTVDVALGSVAVHPAERLGASLLGRVRTGLHLMRARPVEWACALVAGGLAAAVYLTEIVRILVADRAWLATRTPDDAYYYLEIGQRAAHGQGFSFDGFTPTNGFHPLWELIVTGLGRVTSGEALVRAALVTGVLLALAGTVLLALLVRRAFGGAAALLAVLVAVHMPSAMEDVSNGMESAAVVLCVGLVLWALWRADRLRRRRDLLLLGAACGLLVMARLDFLLVVWILPLFAWVRLRTWRVPLLSAVGAALLSGPYFIWDRVAFGHWLSVSGTVKQAQVGQYVDARFGGHLTWGYLHFLDTVLDGVGSVMWRIATMTSADGTAQVVVGDVLAALCLVGLVVLGRRLRREGLRGERGAALLALGAGVVMLALKTVVDAVFSPFWVASWYAAAQRIAFCMLVGVLLWMALEPLRSRMPRAGWLPVAVLGLLFVPLNLGGVTASAHTPLDGSLWPGADLQAVDWITTSGPPGRYGSTDAGVLGFYSDGSHATMSDLDGLTSSYAYADALLDGVPPLQRYRMLHLDFLVGRREIGSPDVPSCAPVIWTSPHAVQYGGGLDSPKVTWVPLRIWDLRPCY